MIKTWNDILSHIAKFIGYLHPVCLFWVICTLMFTYEYQKSALWIFFITYALDYVINCRWRHWKWSKDKWEYVFFLLFFLLIPLRHLFEGISNDDHYIQVLEYRLAFVGFGLIGLLGVSDKYKLRYCGYAFIATAVLTSLYLIFAKVGFNNFVDAESKTNVFAMARIAFVNAHMTFNLYLNIALIFVGYIVTRKDFYTAIRCLVGACGFFIYYILYISEGRTGFVTANLIVCSFILYRIWYLARKAFAPSVILSMIVLFLLVANHQRISSNAISQDPRSIIWDVCIEMVKERPLFGYGVCEARQQLIERGMRNPDFVLHYAEPYIIQNPVCDGVKSLDMMHPHNAFLEVTMEFGVFGLLLIVLWMFYPLVMSTQHRRIYLYMFVGAFCLQSLFESLGPHLMPFLFGLMVLLWNEGSDGPMFEKKQLKE